ncbi:uncharacterized protein PGTG_16761 [Puccinia graminis f. sp. tritici CRL 75-36-700-3]|uniref:DUF7872 domain-containing protein n=2 Tax=Puccinia graminis f. sp. tritici TaxID=56615 RepID=E3L2E8_PUCGT|nr:uncharacterized protein PGTG_16761 [Puccinia graminis f. sp. tritici CRL 75-36-700-3]EFP90735.2 hypothetical protein PGTG_16761 [Puccinia graminis f. sp. tritici CRL 75-36-700-3]
MYRNKSSLMRVLAPILTFCTLLILSTRPLIFAKTETSKSASPFELDPCGVNTANFSLTPELWQSAQMDQYIAKHPLTQNSTIANFAASLGMTNFFCGIGLDCAAGQICYPAIGKDYLILYAVQQWNNFMNQLYRVISSVTMMLSDTSAVMVTDFIPLGIKGDKTLFGYGVATLVFASIAMFTGPLVALFSPVKALPGAAAAAKDAQAAAKSAADAQHAAADAKTVPAAEAAIGVADTQSLRNFAGAHSGTSDFPHAPVSPKIQEEFKNVLFSGRPAAPKRRWKRDLSLQHKSSHRLQKRGPPNILAYTRWSFLDIHLAKLRIRIQSFIAITVKTALSTPIYSDAGIAPIIMQGAFLAPNPTWESMVADTTKLANIVLLSELFVSLGFVATIGQDPCKFEGPRGAWGGNDVLSHCDEQGVMRSIVMVEGDKFEHRLRNANLLRDKYKYDVYDLVTRAADCQAKYGVYGANTAPTPVKDNSPCAFQLPVCDMTTPEVQRRLTEKHARKKHMAKICREEQKLPI